MGRLLEEDDVVDWLLKRTEMYDATGHFVDENVVKKNIESQIAKIPSAQPPRPSGEWIEDGHHIQCDKCGMYMCNTDKEGDTIPRNFCPNCGADMRGEQK